MKKQIHNIYESFKDFESKIETTRNFVSKTVDDCRTNLIVYKKNEKFSKSVTKALVICVNKGERERKTPEDILNAFDAKLKILSKRYGVSLKEFNEQVKSSLGADCKLGMNKKNGSLRETISHKINYYSMCSKIALNNGLINFITFFEEFISEVLKYYFLVYPSLLNEEKLEYKELSLCASKEEIINSFAESKGSSIMLKSPNEIFEQFKKFFGIELEYYKRFKIQIAEIFSRRNILIHNNGIVNNQYINSSKNPYGLQINQEAPITIDYLYDSSTHLLLVASEMAIQMLACFRGNKKKYDDADNIIGDIAFEHYLCKYDWKFSLEFYEILKKNPSLKSDSIDMYKLNIALCKKMLHKKFSIGEEKTWLKKRPFLQIGYYAIVDAYKELSKLIIENKDNLSEQITAEYLSEWPIFKCFRENEPELYKNTLEALA